MGNTICKEQKNSLRSDKSKENKIARRKTSLYDEMKNMQASIENGVQDANTESINQNKFANSNNLNSTSTNRNQNLNNNNNQLKIAENSYKYFQYSIFSQANTGTTNIESIKQNQFSIPNNLKDTKANLNHVDI